MTMPRFTADASLYQTCGHYRTGRYNSSVQTAGPIWLAAVDDDIWGHETIVVREHLTEPPVIIDMGPIPGGPAGDEGGPGGGDDGGEPSKEPHKLPPAGPRNPIDGCTMKQLQSADGKRCDLLVEKDLMNNVPIKDRHYHVCTESTHTCCQGTGEVIVCDDPERSPR